MPYSYWHLQKDGALVNVGDTVKTGQAIALSGKTGYAAVPHLHFMVWTNYNDQWGSRCPQGFKQETGQDTCGHGRNTASLLIPLINQATLFCFTSYPACLSFSRRFPVRKISSFSLV
ncbi:MAG: M23 family metallopeptidase [Bacteroidota bacterium]